MMTQTIPDNREQISSPLNITLKIHRSMRSLQRSYRMISIQRWTLSHTMLQAHIWQRWKSRQFCTRGTTIRNLIVARMIWCSVPYPVPVRVALHESYRQTRAYELRRNLGNLKIQRRIFAKYIIYRVLRTLTRGCRVSCESSKVGNKRDVKEARFGSIGEICQYSTYEI